MPPKSNLSGVNMPSLQDYGFINSKDARKAAGIGESYVDAYNDRVLAQYNNEYNYALWQQQAEYNSPAAQMQRAREAGLNPNVVAGNVSSGNLNSTPSSNANFKSHTLQDRMSIANTSIQAVNSVLNGLRDMVSSVSTISGIPSNIQGARQALTSLLGANAESKKLDNMLHGLSLLKEQYLLTGESSGWENALGMPGGVSANKEAPWFKQIDLRNSAMELMNAIREYTLSDKLPADVEKIKAATLQAESSNALNGANIGLSLSRKEYQDIQNDWLSALNASKVLGPAIKALLPILIKAL